MSGDVFAVSGASGRLGGLVAGRLAASGAEVRLLGRDPSRLPDLAGAVAAPPCAYGDGESMRRALDGASVFFMVSAHEDPDRVRAHTTAVDAAVAAGVERIVYVSFQGAAPDATFTFARDHWYTEQHVRASGMPFTFLRDSNYLGMFALMAGEDGVIRGPGGDGRVAAVAHEDVADTAAAALLADAYTGQTFDVTGPAAFSLAEAAEELSRASGRTVRYVDETEAEAYASRAVYGAPEWEVAGWVTSYQAIAHGELAAVSDTVPRLTGHPATTLREYLATHPV